MVSCLCLQSVFLYLLHPGMLTFSYCSGIKQVPYRNRCFYKSLGFSHEFVLSSAPNVKPVWRNTFPHIYLGPCSPSSPCW